MTELKTISEALAKAREGYPRVTSITAQALLAHVTGRGRSWLLAHPEARLGEEEAARFSALLARAAAGEPLAHLVGEREFCGLPFTITPDVLIPRPETESLVEAVLDWAHRHSKPTLSIVDVGTGSGAIAIALAVMLPLARVAAVEISEEALEIARYNAERYEVAARIHFVQGDLLNDLTGPFDVIVANLPYINHEELSALEVGRWEPRVALDGGPDGLDLIRALLRQAPSRLARGGLLLLEIGYDQGERVVSLCRAAFPGATVTLRPDLAGLDRVVHVEAES